MDEQVNIDEQYIRHCLAPLREVRPAQLHSAPRSRRRLTLAVALAVFAFGAAGAGYGVHVLMREAAPVVSPLAPGEPFACQGLEGSTAGEAVSFFRARGISVSWRFTKYTDSLAGGVEGYASAPATVRPDRIVEDVTWADAAHSGVIVFVRAADDRNAPPIDKPSCP
jgi:hypothetical protein